MKKNINIQYDKYNTKLFHFRKTKITEFLYIYISVFLIVHRKIRNSNI